VLDEVCDVGREDAGNERRSTVNIIITSSSRPLVGLELFTLVVQNHFISCS
jgi:hypothetical protein